MNKLKELKEYIQKEIPEILELKFGCEITGDDKHPKLIYVGFNSNQHGLFIPEIQALLFVNKIETEIIGRPITLEDVLRVIEKNRDYVTINLIGDYLLFQSQRIGTKSWKLGLPLDQQSEETTNFLWDLLIRDK